MIGATLFPAPTRTRPFRSSGNHAVDRHARLESHCNGVIARNKHPFNYLSFDDSRNDEWQSHDMRVRGVASADKATNSL
jgi:hypothetical protein